MNTPSWLPWRDYHEDLKLERLVEVGNLFRSTWLRVSELHEPSEGDSMWSLSCRAFQRSVYRLEQAKQSWNWLSVHQVRPMQYVLAVGCIPVRFYHGESDEVPRRYSAAPDVEKNLRQVILDLDSRVQEGVLLRFATETDAKGVPLAVTILEYEEATDVVLNTFSIPESTSVGGAEVAEFPKPRPRPGVLLPKPAVQPRHGRVKDNVDEPGD